LAKIARCINKVQIAEKLCAAQITIFWGGD